MMNPHTIEMDDVTQVFFEHTNPVSHLTDLGHQRLAAHLDDAQEGVQYDYIVPGKFWVPIVFCSCGDFASSPLKYLYLTT